MSESSQPAEMRSTRRERHGCLTTYLFVLITLDPFIAWSYLARRPGYTHLPHWATSSLAAIVIADTVFCVALLRWKKWGFYGMVVTGLLALPINLSIELPERNYRSASFSVLGAGLGIALLYWVLQIGREKKAWPRLE